VTPKEATKIEIYYSIFCVRQKILSHPSPMLSSVVSFLSNNSVPSLRLRKDIWTHFPVCLVKIPTADGRDRYSVQWHKKNLAEWSQNIPGYEDVAKLRLMQALVSSDRWTVERPVGGDNICVIAMNFSAAEQTPMEKELPNLAAEQIMVEFIDDLKNYFPIVWKKSGGGVGKCVLEFHNTQVRAIAQKGGITEADVRRDVLLKMIPILETKWKVLMTNKPNGSEICTVYERESTRGYDIAFQCIVGNEK
jgi:hypothetical protein